MDGWQEAPGVQLQGSNVQRSYQAETGQLYLNKRPHPCQARTQKDMPMLRATFFFGFGVHGFGAHRVHRVLQGRHLPVAGPGGTGLGGTYKT